MRDELLKTLPDGEAEAEWFLDSDGADLDTPVRFESGSQKQGEQVEVDYTGCAPADGRARSTSGRNPARRPP